MGEDRKTATNPKDVGRRLFPCCLRVGSMASPIQPYPAGPPDEVSGNAAGAPYPIRPAGDAPDPQDFALCLATVDGYVYSVGASDKLFSIQSISKPFSYGLAMADHGVDAVDEKVDVEPSGDPFYEISLAPSTGRPAYAMINAGSLAVVSMFKVICGQSAPR